ncbi:MAG: transcriptional regulator TrmB [Parcubacteria group bacterium Gr01-1014_48]|nr:MAG: transcriptional regulator TrmB [Parcubacteria group bacterium Greene0416_14]TSC73826.1 MAG: transcriptional regulator TrmB [Parcubacteria group bacterium Gr01-1014_48]TSD01207.1 MAG: transcriptional regulator TrmB [Parcubacteria group bacterium Greene1014_15]TSD07317.1 MAG: transcriptional regulator TrmB [Parcubacteria group bacterium Greene0714_4]
MRVEESLASLGLNEKQAKVYVALLQLGRSSAYVIATKSGLKKPTTYVILDELIEKGLVLKVPRMRKQLYEAKSPEEFFAIAEERLVVAKKILPELMAMTKGEEAKVRSMFFEGIAGAKQALGYHMKEMQDQEIVGFYASSHDAPQEFLDLAFEWCDEIEKRNMHVRGIAPVHESLRAWSDRYARKNFNFKFVSFEQYSATISIDVGDTFVRIIAFRGLQSVIIENPDVARTVKQIFEMVWNMLPEQKSPSPFHDDTETRLK